MPFIRFADRPPFRNPWAEFERIRQGLDELSRSYTDKGKVHNRANVFPALNIYEQNDRLIVTAELPGVRIGDLNVSLESDTLTIQGKRTERPVDVSLSYHRREIEYGSFSRSISLPIKVDGEKVSARLSQGVLNVTLVKAAAVTPRKITISAE